MRKILKLVTILAASTLWVLSAQAGTWHHGRYVPDYGGHGRHQHRDWSGGGHYYGYDAGRPVLGPCWVWDQGHWVWACR